jgi:superfamily II DNA/RNA helicase
MNLSENTLKGIASMGYTTATEVQEKSVPLILSGKEVIARSKTGSGKTLAFGIAILEQLNSGKAKRAVIIAPVRELAGQITDELRILGRPYGYRIICVYGGKNIDVQIKQIYNGVDILVATPGRLLDLFERGTLDLNDYDFVVLDEADKMFEMGFYEDVEKILSNTSYARRIHMFSATISEQVQGIATKFIKHAALVEIGQEEKPPQIAEERFEMERPAKFGKLKELIHAYSAPGKKGKILVFVATQRAAEVVGKKLQADGIRCMFMHGDIRQNQREKIMKAFKESDAGILVATDVAARGIHIDDICLVVNYDEAIDSQTHLHRIGRTGRMGAEGKAITFVDTNPYFKKPRSGFVLKKGPYNPYARDYFGGGGGAPRSGGEGRRDQHGGGRPHGGGRDWHSRPREGGGAPGAQGGRPQGHYGHGRPHQGQGSGYGSSSGSQGGSGGRPGGFSSGAPRRPKRFLRR